MSQEIGTTRRKQISVDPVVPTFVALVLAAFIGGALVHGAFLTPPPADLRAEYCRGYADGDQVRYAVVYDVFDKVQKQSIGNGFEAGLITRDPATGEESDIVPVTGERGWLPVPDPELLGPKEDSCLQATIEQLNSTGLRGPTDEVAVTTTTAPSMMGGGLPEVEE